MAEVATQVYSCEHCAHHVKESRRGHFKDDPYLGREPDFCNAVEIPIEERQKFHVCGGKTRAEQCPAYRYDPFKP
jgi:hypothetical protein